MTYRASMAAAAFAMTLGAVMCCQHQALAVNKPRELLGNATNFCQAALPVFDDSIRKRPLAVQNEGTSNAFVTCSFTSQGTITEVVVFFYGEIDTSVACTGVAGTGAPGDATYAVQTAEVQSFVQAPLTWNSGNFGKIFSTFSLSCILPPGTGIQDSHVKFAEDIGQ